MSKAAKPSRTLSCEPLELRDTPATASLYGSTLYVDGTDRADSIVVRQDGSRIVVDGTNIRDGWRSNWFVDAARVRQVVIRGMAGDDTLNFSSLRTNVQAWGGTGNDRVYAGSGNDIVYGDQGNDTLMGAAGDDWLVGGEGVDQIWGGSGNDWITGDNGDDRLYGDSGDDSIGGGEGKDTLSGGAGTDQFDGHGFGMGRADLSKNFDVYTDEFDLWRPIATTASTAVLKKGELDNTGYMAALGSLSLADMKAMIRVIGRGTYDVYLPGDRRTVRVTFDGSWNDNDPMPANGSFASILINRARLVSYGLDPNRYYSNDDWAAQNSRTRGKLFDPSDALRQFTGRTVANLTPSRVDFNWLKSKVASGAAAVVYSYRTTATTPNSMGIMGDTTYVVRRAFTDVSGNRWIELGHPNGADVGNGKLLDNAPGSVRQNDGIITLAWADFQRSSNFTAMYVA